MKSRAILRRIEHRHQGSIKSYRILYQDAAGLGGEVTWDGEKAERHPGPRDDLRLPSLGIRRTPVEETLEQRKPNRRAATVSLFSGRHHCLPLAGTAAFRPRTSSSPFLSSLTLQRE